MNQKVIFIGICIISLLIGFAVGRISKRQRKDKYDGTIYIQLGEEGQEQVIWDLSGIGEDELLERKQLLIKVQNNIVYMYADG